MRRMPFRHLSPGIEILAADGRFTAVEGRSSARPVILLARDLCAFEHRKSGGRNRSSAVAEARLHAQREGVRHAGQAELVQLIKGWVSEHHCSSQW